MYLHLPYRYFHHYSINLKKTLHRAVDTIDKTIESVQLGIELGFDTILSSGGENTALNGLSVLADMQLLAAGKIEVMPGSGINSITAKEILNSHHFDWIHSSCSIQKNADRYTDVESIKNLKNAIN